MVKYRLDFRIEKSNLIFNIANFHKADIFNEKQSPNKTQQSESTISKETLGNFFSHFQFLYLRLQNQSTRNI